MGENPTERRLDVLQTAYFSDFFASPRQSTGREHRGDPRCLAADLTDHLRTAQNKILDLLLAEQSANA